MSGATRLIRSRKIEIARIEAFSKPLISLFDNIVKSYPDFDSLPEFYKALVDCCLDSDQLRKSLGAVNWAKRQILLRFTDTKKKIKANKDIAKFNTIRTALLGRVCSIVKQISSDFIFLEDARKVMKRFPTIKTSYFTVVIAGAPNVGKSTLLAALTGSKPEISYYPFTTKNLNFGTDKINKIQFVDTPGLLDRPIKERNEIEQQAIIALQHVANLIIFMFDPTGACGYPMDDQKNLLKEIKQNFKVPIIVVSNKADMGTADVDAIPISAKENVGVSDVNALVLDAKKDWTLEEQDQEESTQ
jgi:nucleolar GTP-binding protein